MINQFRGIRKDKNEFVYGNLHTCIGKAEIYGAIATLPEPKVVDLNFHWILTLRKPCDIGWDIKDTYSAYSVIPETVSESTRLKDKNDTAIFTGDIVDEKYRWAISFEDGSYWGISKTVGRRLLSEIITLRKKAGSPIEIIGNKFQNPELL